MPDTFLDTSFAIALVSPRDQHHSLAREWSGAIRQASGRLVTTTGVLLEIGNGLCAPHRRVAAHRLIESIELDPTIHVVEIEPVLRARARRLYGARPDKSWGLVDCASFVVMRERGLTDALTADHHFEQAGFRALLRGEAPASR